MKATVITNKIMLAILVTTIIAMPSFGQNEKDSSNMKREQFIALSSTNENHKLLADLNGTWAFQGRHISPDPAVKPFEFKGTIVRKSLMGERYFSTETRSDGKMPMPWSKGELMTYTDMTIEGYDNVTKKFVAANIANESNTGIIIYEGSYDPTTKTITYEAQSATHLHPDIAPGTVMKFLELVKIIDSDHFILEHHESIAGKRIVTTELKYTRIKSK